MHAAYGEFDRVAQRVLPGRRGEELERVARHRAVVAGAFDRVLEGAMLLHRGDRRVTTNKQIRETEAEATAFIVCQAIGLETGSAASDYIQLWNGDVHTLTESLGHIRQAASQMLGALTDA